MVTQITRLPTPPSRQRPSTFSDEADVFLGALPDFGGEANALAVEVNTKTVEAGDSATLASQWATKTSSEVVAGQGFGAKKYATDAAASASAAYGSANTATTKAGEAAASAIAAGGSASAAKNSAIEASKLNLGAKATAPTTDNQGDALRSGATYFDTSLDLWRVWNGSAWVVGISSVAGVSSFNGQVGDIVYEMPQLTTPSIISPLSGDISLTSGVFVAEKSKSIYGTPVGTKFQFSTSSDFTTIFTESDWIYSLTDTVECQATALATTGVFYWRVLCKTSVNGAEYLTLPSTHSSANIVAFDAAYDVDGLASFVTIQTEWRPSTTYSAGQSVVVRFSDIEFVEYKSITSGNSGNNPVSSPTHWEVIYDNNVTTSGYFGEVLGSKCVVDKGGWNSATTYAVGDIVVVANNTPPLTQADLTAYVSKTASNLNKPPAANPADWEQRNGLPTGTSLAQTLGIGNATPEVLINNDSGWLKFVHNGKIKYIAKKPFMHTVSWNDIAKAEAVYGNRTVRIGSRLFRVSLLSGAEADPSSFTTSSTASDNKGAGSEWNELVYRVNVGVPADGATTYQGGKQVGLNWWNFTDADIVVGSGNGRFTWCKETLAFNTANRVLRGVVSLSSFHNYTSSTANTDLGWRPCLTLISDEELEGSLYKAEATGVGPSVASLQYDPITDTGYYGEVTSAQFYTGTRISTATGVTGGALQNDTEGWLKFYWHGQVLFIAKKTYRYSISWDSINSANAVYGVNLGSTGKKTITHSGSSTKYDVKLLKGAIKDPSPASGGGRQWNELLYRVCTGTETGQIGANWASFNPSLDLGINSGNGSYTWCQEVYQPNTANRVFRVASSLSTFSYNASSYTSAYFGWRPCLAFSV